MAHNKELPWSPAVGFFPAEFLAGAFPVLPRFRLSFDCLLQCSFSAFFNQPIIPVGHHEEVRDGLELLATVANHINSFGDVHWLDLQGISRSNFLSRVAGRTFTVQPFSRRFTVTVPENCAELALDRIWVRIGYRQDVQESLFFRRSGDASWTAAMEDKISVAPGEDLQNVANRTGISVAQLQAMNSGVDLKSTTKLVVPNSSVKLTKWVRATPASEAAAPSLNKVRARKGDTIASIAASRNLDANEVARLNGISVDAELRAGQEVKIPATAAAPSRRR